LTKLWLEPKIYCTETSMLTVTPLMQEIGSSTKNVHKHK
jgi:hypothetical protein